MDDPVCSLSRTFGSLRHHLEGIFTNTKTLLLSLRGQQINYTKLILGGKIDDTVSVSSERSRHYLFTDGLELTILRMKRREDVARGSSEVMTMALKTKQNRKGKQIREAQTCGNLQRGKKN